MKLEEATQGQRVVYVPLEANGDISHPRVEYGTVSSVGIKFVFVRFDKQVKKKENTTFIKKPWSMALQNGKLEYPPTAKYLLWNLNGKISDELLARNR